MNPASGNPAFETTEVVGIQYAELDYEAATNVIVQWSEHRRAETVVVAPVSSVIMAKRDPELRSAFQRAGMITSDGMPIVWMRRMLGRAKATRLYGPDLMRSVCSRCAAEGIRVGLIGGRPERIDGLVGYLEQTYPGLQVTMSASPPFQELTDMQVAALGSDARYAGCGIVFVGLGCPKQEKFMERMRPHFPGVQVGVGAAFDLVPGFVRQAPPRLQRMGLEWAYRISREPKRLWKRYATTIPPFVWMAAVQLATYSLIDSRGQRRCQG